MLASVKMEEILLTFYHGANLTFHGVYQEDSNNYVVKSG